MIRSHDFVQHFILGALAAALSIGIVWLIVGDTPAWWVTMLAVEAMALAGALALRAQRRRHIARIQADFDRPAFGEDRL
ncbi:hypothetical protein AB0387_25960 [Streptomyces sp. NPDC089173]|uniref:hypothetical protein n=1 Tax=Streptomyces sp. NPDC089173 TaxID=3154965 RepID=UPI00344F79F4